MAYTLTFNTNATSTEVIRAIKRDAAYWRESVTQPSLQQQHILSIDVSVNGERFELFPVYSRRPPWNWVAIYGKVESHPDGARIIARVCLKRGTIWAVAFLGILGAVMAVSDLKAALFFWALGGFLALKHIVIDRAILPGRNDVADHLDERLRGALEPLEVKGAERSA